ncbi:MAG: ABC transporter substrate-binding protein [Chloroflexi bacterium]|nr:ABC transporter substrate-binding protein [Chloroflexota bacterium]
MLVKRRYRVGIGSISLALALMVGLLVSACAPQAPAKIETVKVGDLGYLADAAFYIGVEKGYFAEQGIKPEFTRFRSAADMVAPLSTGELHVGGGTVSVGLYNAVIRGLDVKIVVDRAYDQKPYDSDWLVVRSDLKDKIKTAADLKGKKFDMIAPGSVTYYTIGKGLKRAGLSLKDLDIVHLGPAQIAAAFERKAVDAAVAVEPIATVMQDQGLVVKWMMQDEFVGEPVQVAVAIYSGDWAKKNPEVAKKFMVAYLKGLRDMYEAMRGGPVKKDVVAIGIKYTAMKEPAQYDKASWSDVNPDGYVDKKSLAAQVDWYLEQGLITEKVNVDKVVDNTYLDYAISKLGKYKKK